MGKLLNLSQDDTHQPYTLRLIRCTLEIKNNIFTISNNKGTILYTQRLKTASQAKLLIEEIENANREDR